MTIPLQGILHYLGFSSPAVANLWRHRKVTQLVSQIRTASKVRRPTALLYGVAAIRQEHGRLLAEYALCDISKPIGVAHWATKIVEKLPAELKDSLPTVEKIEAELSGKRQRRAKGKKS